MNAQLHLEKQKGGSVPEQQRGEESQNSNLKIGFMHLTPIWIEMANTRLHKVYGDVQRDCGLGFAVV